jgi:CRISPR-associated protein Csb2
MVTLGFQFPAGRYHATPWQHQVNEGQVEWPPCPWRLLRALISCGFARLGWDNPPAPAATGLICALSERAPSYSVPAAHVAHSRHYMPIGQMRTGTQLEATTLVLDTWANVEAEELQVHWDLVLPGDQLALLSQLAEQLNYLGRSESWVIGRLLTSSETPKPANVVVHQAGVPIDRNEELFNLMAPVPAGAYADWRIERLPPTTTAGNKKPTAKQQKEQEKAEAPYPADLLAALQWDTERWRSFGWTQPPGSQVLQYRRRRDLLSLAAPPQPNSTLRYEPADMILLSLASSSGSDGLLPSITRTLPQAELLHDALVSQACTHGLVPPSELTGRDSAGKPLRQHQHAHILPLDMDRDGHLDHVLFWANQGFSREAQEAIAGLRRTYTKGGKDALRLALAGRALQSQTEQWPEGLGVFVASSRRWASLTPFVAPRFIKKSGANSLEGQIRAELTSRGLPVPIAVSTDVMPRDGTASERLSTLFRHFVRVRKRGGNAPPQDAGWYVEIEFGQDVTGPICIGYGSHFGLGMMGASRSSPGRVGTTGRSD